MTHEVAQRDRAVILFESEGEDVWHVAEMGELASSADVDVVGQFFSRVRRRPGQPFISSDRAGDLRQEVLERGANVLLVADDLGPSEHAELQKEVGVRVVDRTQLILDIFAQRAHTREGKLQVELAQLNYLLPRLSGAGAAMSRLGGGVGTRGPGETKLESDRRRFRRRIDALTDEIDSVRKHREVARTARQKLPFPSAALVGYTSAGKSTILNLLSGSDVPADAQLFSTLDPTTRRVVLPDGWGVLVTDTVGFIRSLPHSLIAAFRATLEEVALSDVLILVVDASHPNRNEQIQAVQATLAEIGVHEKPTVTVFNKSDLCPDTYELRRLVAEDPFACYMSALKRDGVPHLIAKVKAAVESLLVPMELLIPYERSDLVSQCYDYGRVLKADYCVEGVRVTAELAHSFAIHLRQYLAPPAAKEG